MYIIIVFLSLCATINTIRVPVWTNVKEKDVYVDNRPRIGYATRQPQFNIPPSSRSWTQPSYKNKYYKKPVDRQSFYKKNFFSKPLQRSNTKNVKAVVPLNKYMSTSQANNFDHKNRSQQSNNFLKPYSQIFNVQKPQSTTLKKYFQPLINKQFDQNQYFNIPTITKQPKLPNVVQKVESYKIPQSYNYNLNNFQTLQDFEPAKVVFYQNTPQNNKPEYVSLPTKNYRDEKTHEPSKYKTHYLPTEGIKIDSIKHEKTPISSHEITAEILTKPIYPGRGFWPKPDVPNVLQKAESSKIPQSNNYNFNNFRPLQDFEQAFYQNTPQINKPEYVSHLTKNYRNDKTHEPSQYETHHLPTDELKIDRKEHEKAPISSHEIPAEIPTKPIYPGPGLWAKPGLKHKPFISKQKYDELEEDKVKPDGYDTFEEGQKLYENTKNAFEENLEDFPKQHNFNAIESSGDKEEQTDTSDEINEDEEEDDEFVPMKLYAQVRASENTKHLPENEDDGRLKEIIKEAKVHTVYTEEGYEDSAYDHAGHEKEAANDEGFEDLQREKIEKKEKRPQHLKYNLHLPKLSTTQYSVGNGVLSDEEIKEMREAQLGITDDTDAAGTQFEEIHNTEDIEEDNDSDERTIVNNGERLLTGKPMKKNKNFITTKETKTMTTKEKDNGNTETEFSSKIRTVLQPNNSTETQKYEKVFPKVYKTIQRVNSIPVVEEPQDSKKINFSEIFIEEIITTSTPPTEELSEEIPITTLPTTAIPKSENLDVLDDIDESFSQTRTRVKRFSNDFSDVRLNVGFFPSIDHDLGKGKDDNTHLKYPYYEKYKTMGINENSPLRYSEDLKNIPRKTGKRMVFYEEAERKITCPEVPQTVNAIPDRVLKAEQNKEEEENETEEDTDEEKVKEPKKLAEQPKTPRLSGLGDQIDCLKVKYFGENPLDSPFFKEDTIAPPTPIFNILKSKNVASKKKVFENEALPTQNTDTILTNNIKDKVKTNKQENQQINPTTTTLQTLNLFTTPKYTITLKPKHIYHQIKLLDYLPAESNLEQQTQTQQNTKQIEDNLVFESSDLYSFPEINSVNGLPYLVFDVNREESIQEKVENATPRQSRALKEETDNGTELLPEAEEWRRRKVKRKRIKRPPFQIFDVNKFVPSTPYSIFNENIQTSTVLPKYKVDSEVFYKDNIQPNEQLQVLTDILNNIKNSSQEQSSDALIQSSEPVSISISENKPYNQDSYLQAYGEQEVDVNYYSSQVTSSTTAPTTTTTIKPVTFTRNHYRLLPTRPTVNPAVIRDREEKFKLYLSLLKGKKQPQYTTSTVNGVTIPVTENIKDYDDKTTKVMGLMPPSTQRYKTILHPKRDNNRHVSNAGHKKLFKMNKFYVVGMRPPPKQNILYYPEFSMNKNNHALRRGKRSTSYSALSRNRGQQDKSTDSEEDEAPHRPKNYYYDEQTGKIVYRTTEKPESQEEEEEEEIEYEEVIEEPRSTSKPLQDPVFATATPPPEGKSYVDFVNKLHHVAGYKDIPDPTTTEKGQELSTTTTTAKPESTTPPLFLDIVNKIRKNSQYKVIEDKNEKKTTTTTTTTTETPEEFVDDDDEDDKEEDQENVQNSPGGYINEHYKELGIFDVTNFIPKIKNYLPKTSYDISKYKTIARSTSRPTTTDDSDSEDLEEITTPIARFTSRPTTQSSRVEEERKTTQKPLLIVTKEIDTSDSLNEATVNKETEKKPVVLQRRRFKITSTTTEQPVTKLKQENLRRRRPTTLRSTIGTSTTEKPSTEATRRNFRRRPTRIKSEATTPTIIEEDEEDKLATKVVRRRSDRTETKSPNVGSKNFVENFKAYHRNKKHRKVDVDGNSSVSESKFVIPEETNNETVEIIANYDKTKRHGGNYRSEKDVINEDKEEAVEESFEDITEDEPKASDDKLIIDLLPNEDDENKSDLEEDDVETTTAKINKPKKFSVSEKSISRSPPSRERIIEGHRKKKVDYIQKHRNVVTEPTLMRLTDVVPKPESFYKDPNLSKSVNMLVSEVVPAQQEVISSLSSTESDESIELSTRNFGSTKKPNIIKDPSKRLYYYAPI